MASNFNVKLIVPFLGLVLFLGTICFGAEFKGNNRNATSARQGKCKFGDIQCFNQVIAKGNAFAKKWITR